MFVLDKINVVYSVLYAALSILQQLHHSALEFITEVLFLFPGTVFCFPLVHLLLQSGRQSHLMLFICNSSNQISEVLQLSSLI